MVRNVFTTGAAILLALLFFANLTNPAHADPPPTCGLLQDCYMAGFYGDEGAGSGIWKIFGNSPGIGLAAVEGWPSGPSVQMHSENRPFDGGIYQQVPVEAGKGYHFDLAWAVETVDGKGYQDWYQVNRRLGIDPFGGTDPNSPNVQWSADHFGSGKFVLALDAYAKAPVITVFIRVTNPYNDHVVDVYLDTASLNVNSGMAPIQITQPTVTPPPPPPTTVPTAKPTRVPPTTASEPTDAPTDEPTTVPTDEPTLEPTVEPTPRPARTRAAQVQPTVRPTRARAVAATQSDNDNASTNQFGAFGMLAVVGFIGLMGAVVLFGAAAFLLLRRK